MWVVEWFDHINVEWNVMLYNHYSSALNSYNDLRYVPNNEFVSMFKQD